MIFGTSASSASFDKSHAAKASSVPPLSSVARSSEPVGVAWSLG